MLPSHTLVCAEDECSAFTSCCTHEWEPGIPGIGGGGEVKVYVLGIERVAKEGHVVFPADGGC